MKLSEIHFSRAFSLQCCHSIQVQSGFTSSVPLETKAFCIYTQISFENFFDLVINSVDMCMLSVCSVLCDQFTRLKIQIVGERVVS